jgi:hypothetical protein
MKKMKTISLFLFSCILFTTACNTTYSVIIEPNTNTYGVACPHPTYIGTMSKSTNFTSILSTLSTALKEDEIYLKTEKSTSISYNQESISLYNLLADARAKYGNEVTIQNVRWDYMNKKRISVIYDVIKCN